MSAHALIKEKVKQNFAGLTLGGCRFGAPKYFIMCSMDAACQGTLLCFMYNASS